MAVSINGILIENFKSYDEFQTISLADMSVFLGANSSGKSTALQTLLLLKQTAECNNRDIDLLLSGKFVTLGDFSDIINDAKKEYIRIGVSLNLKNELETGGEINRIIWKFGEAGTGKEKGKVALIEVEFCINGNLFRLTKEDGHLYSINIEDKSTSLLIEIYNLQLGDLYIKYNSDLNHVFQRFLNELTCILVQKSKTIGIPKTEMVAIFGIEEFYYHIVRSASTHLEQNAEEKCSARYVDDIIGLIDEFSYEQFGEEYRYDPFPDVIFRNCMIILVDKLLQNHGMEDDLTSVITRYRTELEKYKKEKDKKQDEKSRLRRDFEYFQRETGEGSKFDKIKEIRIACEQFFDTVVDNIFYIGPIREKPTGMYNIGFESVPKYVGTTGAFFASVLLQENREKEYLLPEGESEETTLWEALDAWALHLNIASGVHVEQKNSFGFNVIIENTQNRSSDIMNVGIGTSQVLPVLITGLLSEANETLIFEQPELHLHPFSQSRLADFFAVLAKHGRKVIVETHSEYLLLRLRYLVLTEQIEDEQVAVSFFQNDRGTKVVKGVLNSYGNLKYPNDFKDSTQDLLSDILNAAMKKGI